MKNKPWVCLDCRVVMKMVNEDYCRCSICGTEVWFRYGSQIAAGEDEVTSLMRDMAKNKKPREVLPAGPAALGGGGSNRVKKQRSKKDTLATLNQKLYIET